jgi:hypothetical protein
VPGPNPPKPNQPGYGGNGGWDSDSPYAGGNGNGWFDNPVYYPPKPAPEPDKPIIPDPTNETWYTFTITGNNGQRTEFYYSAKPSNDGSVPSGTYLVTRQVGSNYGSMLKFSGGKWVSTSTVSFSSIIQRAGNGFEIGKTFENIQSWADSNNYIQFMAGVLEYSDDFVEGMNDLGLSIAEFYTNPISFSWC